MEPVKKPWQSKTIVLNFLMAASALAYPPVAEWISANPVAVASGWAVLGILVRLITRDRVSLGE